MHQWQWVIPLSNDNDAELIRQFPLGTDLKLRTKEEKPDVQFSQPTKINGSKAQSGSKFWSWLMTFVKSLNTNVENTKNFTPIWDVLFQNNMQLNTHKHLQNSCYYWRARNSPVA